ncbi:hypothetical protein GLOIN_2v1772220 [Rhizophagus clarus]|uniref:Uncharacterized protein n=1 Tax=Rhizophagus clarus TaxID=94130 RepID=A0A8H3MCE5_9GLOM|nr:hypothetical protein GLOIN_2v1772220 [Rhizophagus clarus]
MALGSPRNSCVPSIYLNRVIHKRRRYRLINRRHRDAFNVNTLSQLPLQITNDPFAGQLPSSATNNWLIDQFLNIIRTSISLKPSLSSFILRKYVVMSYVID